LTINIATFTKEYTVGFTRADFDIPKQSWNFVESWLDIQTELYKSCGDELSADILQKC
jgi:hypothetical protein